jgi:hypothetical protein
VIYNALHINTYGMAELVSKGIEKGYTRVVALGKALARHSRPAAGRPALVMGS